MYFNMLIHNENKKMACKTGECVDFLYKTVHEVFVKENPL